jgi:hypothetical protein
MACRQVCGQFTSAVLILIFISAVHQALGHGANHALWVLLMPEIITRLHEMLLAFGQDGGLPGHFS